MSSFRIFGRVVDRNSGVGISDLRVEVWDKDVKHDDLCGTAVTDNQGAYQVEFDESAFRDSRNDILPDIYLKVFAEEVLLTSTADAVRKNVPAGETEIIIEVELNQPRVAAEKKSYILATGLEDYGRWKEMFKDHKREKNEKPFRRGRIWS
ncbi:MAG: cyanobactin biosynthesis PatC/TenC/TruC family protein [Xenococcaceae cyanobacterium]